MPGTESLIPHEWYQRAEEDLLAAQALWRNVPQLQASIIFHLQQAVEKYLKGFLLSRGWTLQRIHDLVRLLGDVIAYEPAFARFDTLCQELTSYYFSKPVSAHSVFPNYGTRATAAIRKGRRINSGNQGTHLRSDGIVR